MIDKIKSRKVWRREVGKVRGRVMVKLFLAGLRMFRRKGDLKRYYHQNVHWLNTNRHSK
jgi:hypothetical protein